MPKMESMLLSIPPRDGAGLVHVIVDTHRGSRNKYKFDEQLGCFRLSRILPAGHVFPYDFGSIPGTRAEDGDALDVLVLSETPSFPGCLMTVRLLGVIVARQTSRDESIRNDRLIAVPHTPVNTPHLQNLSEVDAGIVREIEHFFTSYNLAQGRQFTVIRRQGSAKAARLLERAIERFERDAIQ